MASEISSEFQSFCGDVADALEKKVLGEKDNRKAEKVLLKIIAVLRDASGKKPQLPPVPEAPILAEPRKRERVEEPQLAYAEESLERKLDAVLDESWKQTLGLAGIAAAGLAPGAIWGFADRPVIRVDGQEKRITYDQGRHLLSHGKTFEVQVDEVDDVGEREPIKINSVEEWENFIKARTPKTPLSPVQHVSPHPMK